MQIPPFSFCHSFSFVVETGPSFAAQASLDLRISLPHFLGPGIRGKCFQTGSHAFKKQHFLSGAGQIPAAGCA